MLPGDVYVRQMLLRHHRAALSHNSRAAWEHRGTAMRSTSHRSGGRAWLLMFRLRAAHSGS
jgi:hypothetical protein